MTKPHRLYPFLLSDDSIEFPPVELALEEPNGLLAIAGDLTPQRLISAYKKGVFPWFSDGEPIMWWSPNPRSVLIPNEFKASKSLQKIIRKDIFSNTINQSFEEVMLNCSLIPRGDQNGTWITSEMLKAYTVLHQQGVAISFETWQDNKLVGGLYGLRIGQVFFGESMFSEVSNASKVAFMSLISYCHEQGIGLIDCQVESEHLNSLGARNIDRNEFVDYLNQNTT